CPSKLFQVWFQGFYRLLSLYDRLSDPISDIAVNDEFPVVINKTPKLKATIGSKALLSNEIFNTHDDDGIDSNIIYQIRSDNVSKGSYFILHPDDVPTLKFTQRDVDEERVHFIYNGPESELTYWFRVKDNESITCDEDIDSNDIQASASGRGNSHCSQYYPLTISASEPSLQLLNHTSIQLPQASLQCLI